MRLLTLVDWGVHTHTYCCGRVSADEPLLLALFVDKFLFMNVWFGGCERSLFGSVSWCMY